MAPRSQYRQKTSPSSNASNMKNRKYVVKEQKVSEDQDDIASRTTASTTESPRCSNADSDHDWSPSGKAPSEQGTPTNSPARTSLKSLKSKASLFVPGSVEPELPMEMMMLPPCIPSLGKDCLTGIIQRALGNELWNLNMCDYTSYDGAWHTAVEITIPALSASMCHLVTSPDARAIEAAQMATQSQAVQSLTRALEDHQPSVMHLQPADASAQVCVEFCPADKARICRSFSQGGCARGDSCHFAHVVIETFMINFLLAPLTSLECGVEMQTPQAAESKPVAKWVPSRAPIPPTPSIAPAAALPKKSAEIKAMKPLTPDTRPKNPRLVGKKSWADIEEDSDDDRECSPMWK